MADKKIITAEVTDDELNSLTPEQLKELQDKGEVTVAVPDPPAGVEGEVIPPVLSEEEKVTLAEQERVRLRAEADSKPLTRKDLDEVLKVERAGWEKTRKGLVAEVVKMRREKREDREKPGEAVEKFFLNEDGTPMNKDQFLTVDQAKKVLVQAGERDQKKESERQIEFVRESCAIARAEHLGDEVTYEESFAAFQKALLADPTLIDKVYRDQNPGEATYKFGKEAMGKGTIPPPVVVVPDPNKPRPTIIGGSAAGAAGMTPETVQKRLDSWERLTPAQQNEVLMYLNQ